MIGDKFSPMLIPATVVAFLLFPALAAAQGEEPTWGRVGLEFRPRVQPIEVIDITRVTEQRERGCAVTDLHFGDTALMRGTFAPPAWTERQSVRSIAASAFADRPAIAQEALAAALELEAATPGAAPLIDTLSALSAMQFADIEDAEARLSALRERTDLPAPMRADILFWSAVAASSGVDAAAWSGPIDAWLTEALEADPTAVQVRAFRVLSWLQGRMWENPADQECTLLAQAFSERLLDLTDIGACRLMVGHFDLALQRSLGARPESQADSELALWQSYSSGFFALLVGAEDAAEAAQLALAASDKACAPVLTAALSALSAAEAGEP